MPLPPNPDLIAAILQAASGESHTMVARDPVMLEAVRRAEQVAGSEASILITGESGTGKEVMARHIHRRSRRANGAFVALNCAAIPENLLESEMFGHERGAFSGAIACRAGKFEAADGGSLLLDEISEMDVRLQAKLLRVIQEREIDRVGGTAPVKVNVRILATSNRDLLAEVGAGRFREDLFFSPQRCQLTPAGLAGTAGRHRSAFRPLRAPLCRGERSALPPPVHRSASAAREPWVARQRSRVGEHGPSCGTSGFRRRHWSRCDRTGFWGKHIVQANGLRRHRPGRPHDGRGGARPHPRNAGTYSWDSHPRGNDSRHLHPCAPQPASRLRTVRPGSATSCLRSLDNASVATVHARIRHPGPSVGARHRCGPGARRHRASGRAGSTATNDVAGPRPRHLDHRVGAGAHGGDVLKPAARTSPAFPRCCC